MIGTLAQEYFRHNDNEQGISAKWGGAGGSNHAMSGLVVLYVTGCARLV
jgi:hypothetical protein